MSRAQRLVPWAALLIALLWAPLILPADHSWDDADPEVLNNAYRIARGEPLYHGLTGPPWVVSPYTPLYHGLLGACLRFAGLSYWPARALSLLSTAAVAGGLALLARRWKSNPREGLWATCLLLLVPAVLYNAARPHPQMLAVALTLWSFALFESPHVLVADLASPLLSVLAIYTKQTQVVLPLALSLWMAWRRPARLWRYAGAVAFLGLAPVPWLQATTHGFFLRTVLGANLLPYDFRQIPFVLISHAGILFLFLGLAATRLTARWRTPPAIEPLDAYFTLLIPATIGSLGRAGAHSQYVVELIVVAMVYLLRTGGLPFASSAPATSPRREALAVAQIGLLLAYSPAFVLLQEGLWDRESNAAAPAVRALLQTEPGPVISQQGSFSLFTRGEIHVQLFHFEQLAKLGRWDETPLVREVEERRVAWLVTEFPLENIRGFEDTDPDARERFTPRLLDALLRNYVRRAKLGPYYVYEPRRR